MELLSAIRKYLIAPLNETKAELIVFRSPWKHLPYKPDIAINNYNLTSNNPLIKIPCIRIDEILFWNEQIDATCTKPDKANGILSKLRHLVPKMNVVSVYFSLFCYTFL